MQKSKQRRLDFSSAVHSYDPEPVTPTLWLQQAGKTVAVFPAAMLALQDLNPRFSPALLQ